MSDPRLSYPSFNQEIISQAQLGAIQTLFKHYPSLNKPSDDKHLLAVAKVAGDILRLQQSGSEVSQKMYETMIRYPDDSESLVNAFLFLCSKAYQGQVTKADQEAICNSHADAFAAVKQIEILRRPVALPNEDKKVESKPSQEPFGSTRNVMQGMMPRSTVESPIFDEGNRFKQDLFDFLSKNKFAGALPLVGRVLPEDARKIIIALVHFNRLGLLDENIIALVIDDPRLASLARDPSSSSVSDPTSSAEAVYNMAVAFKELASKRKDILPVLFVRMSRSPEVAQQLKKALDRLSDWGCLDRPTQRILDTNIVVFEQYLKDGVSIDTALEMVLNRNPVQKNQFLQDNKIVQKEDDYAHIHIISGLYALGSRSKELYSLAQGIGAEFGLAAILVIEKLKNQKMFTPEVDRYFHKNFEFITDTMQRLEKMQEEKTRNEDVVVIKAACQNLFSSGHSIKQRIYEALTDCKDIGYAKRIATRVNQLSELGILNKLTEGDQEKLLEKSLNEELFVGSILEREDNPSPAPTRMYSR